MKQTYPSDISVEQFERVQPILEQARKKARPRTVDLHHVFCGVLYVLKSGCQWRMLPKDFPKWRTCYEYFCNLPDVKNVLADGGYTGQPFADGVKQIHGATVEIAKRNELHKFAVLPKRWVVERSFGWLEKSRRLWKNCERKLNTSRNMMALAFLTLLLKRL